MSTHRVCCCGGGSEPEWYKPAFLCSRCPRNEDAPAIVWVTDGQFNACASRNTRTVHAAAIGECYQIADTPVVWIECDSDEPPGNLGDNVACLPEGWEPAGQIACVESCRDPACPDCPAEPNNECCSPLNENCGQRLPFLPVTLVMSATARERIGQCCDVNGGRCDGTFEWGEWQRAAVRGSTVDGSGDCWYNGEARADHAFEIRECGQNSTPTIPLIVDCRLLLTSTRVDPCGGDGIGCGGDLQFGDCRGFTNSHIRLSARWAWASACATGNIRNGRAGGTTDEDWALGLNPDEQWTGTAISGSNCTPAILLWARGRRIERDASGNALLGTEWEYSALAYAASEVVRCRQ